MVPVYVDDVFMAGNLEILKVIKETIKEKFNISGSGYVKEFLGVYYDQGYDAKSTYAKMTTEKDVKKLVEGYKNYMGSDSRVQKHPVAQAQL